MLIIGDKRLPQEVKKRLSKFGEFIDFSSNGIVYESISGHPDIFFHKYENKLIIAPNLPEEFLKLLSQTSLHIILGESALGFSYPDTARYNASYNSEFLFCNSQIIDNQILNIHSDKKLMHVNQGYTACNIIIGEKSILASDKGICKNINAKYFNPEEIILSGVNNGFLGGSCSIYKSNLLINGSLKYISQNSIIEDFASDNSLKLIELYDGPLIDGGGYIFID